MDTTRSSIFDLPTHEHPLLPSARFTGAECRGCHVKETIYGGYFCNEPYCYGWFHKECAEAPPEINHHPSHLEHPLLLINGSQSNDGPCDCCGKKILSPFYTCPTCEFKVDLICGMKPLPHAIEHPKCHDHSLVVLKKRDVEVPCDACKESIGGPSYSCLECHVYFHVDCVHLSKEMYHPCHPSHPLKAVESDQSLAENHHVEKSCYFCPDKKKVIYHCSLCNFTMCIGCIKNPPPLVVEDTKTHKHPLRLFSNRILATCKLCGVDNGIIPYICFKCSFFVHGACIALPQVININRHDHRIFFTHHLGRRGTKCGFCWRNVSQYYGAYFCSVCPSYTVHTRCAFKYTIWNGMELEGIPEKSEEDIAPFKVVGHNLICHFSHSEHTLRLLKNIDFDESIRCEACIRPVGWFGSIYACVECRFVLHEKCANLATKKRLVFDIPLYTLECDNQAVYCRLCGMYCDGFKYTSEGRVMGMGYPFVDVHCGSLSEPLFHNAHLHRLYFVDTKDRSCVACKRAPNTYMLVCRACEFDLCLYCVTLPEMIWHMSDEHPLFLYYYREGSSQNWCDICESELDPSQWFYTCADCGVELHAKCVLGDFSRLKPERLYTFGGRVYQVLLNNRNTRPFCSHCHSRCKVSIILEDKSKDNGYICSLSCFSSCLGMTCEFGYLQPPK